MTASRPVPLRESVRRQQSYVNFYIANEVVVAFCLGDLMDEKGGKAILQELFPTRVWLRLLPAT